MKCEVCGSYNLNKDEHELICFHCGAAYGLELLGYYKEGSCERIECGKEYDSWLESYKNIEGE
jgi:hypothetical protein